MNARARVFIFSVGAALVLLLASAHPAFASGGACPTGANYLDPANPPGPHVTLSSLGVTSCFYVSDAGSDSSAGTSEASPWLHAPGMPSCTGKCSSTSLAPGEGFIFRGGDTWHFGDSAAAPYTGGLWNWPQAGSSGSPVYIGVDPKWFTGSSWARPILTADNPLSTSAVSSCAHFVGADDTNIQVKLAAGNYLHFDDVEFTGYCWNTSGNADFGSEIILKYQGSSSNNNIFIENNYIHGWTHTVAGTQAGGAGIEGYSEAPGVTIQYNVIDGADSDDLSFEPLGQGSDGFYIQYNVFANWGGTNILDDCHIVHDNLFVDINNSNDDSTHSDVMFCFGEYAGGASAPNLFYNNVFHHIGIKYNQGVSDVMTLDAPTGQTDYVFNNVAYDNQPSPSGNYWDVKDDGCTNCNGGYVYFNNTGVLDGADCIICGGGGTPGIIAANNHWITTGGQSSIFSAPSAVMETSALYMTPATAAAEGYTAANNYAPTASSSATVKASGTNLTSTYCSLLMDPAATAACEAGTTAACSYDTSSHTIGCPNVIANSRPSSGAWQVGAYQFGGAPPAPPTGLKCTVH